MSSPRDYTCPRCAAGPLAPCVPVNGDIEPGMTHSARCEAWAAAQPRPERKPITMYATVAGAAQESASVRPGAKQMKLGR